MANLSHRARILSLSGESFEPQTNQAGFPLRAANTGDRGQTGRLLWAPNFRPVQITQDLAGRPAQPQAEKLRPKQRS